MSALAADEMYARYACAGRAVARCQIRVPCNISPRGCGLVLTGRRKGSDGGKDGLWMCLEGLVRAVQGARMRRRRLGQAHNREHEYEVKADGTRCDSSLGRQVSRECGAL